MSDDVDSFSESQAALWKPVQILYWEILKRKFRN